MLAELALWWWFETVQPDALAGMSRIKPEREGPFASLQVCEQKADTLEQRTAPRGPIVIRFKDGSSCFPAPETRR